MRRFVLRHPAFAEPGIEQPGEIVTLGWPLDGEPLVLPELGWRFPGGRTDQHWRNYTVHAMSPVVAAPERPGEFAAVLGAREKSG
jgi:hypothetical protein